MRRGRGRGRGKGVRGGEGYMCRVWGGYGMFVNGLEILDAK